MIDLDGYKQLNDTFGHQLGDQLLVVAARAITTNLRKMDVAARYGGDEFVLLLPRAATDEAGRVVNRIREDFWPARPGAAPPKFRRYHVGRHWIASRRRSCRHGTARLTS